MIYHIDVQSKRIYIDYLIYLLECPIPALLLLLVRHKKLTKKSSPIVKNYQNGLKWSKMVTNGPKWFKMVQNGEKW